MRILYIVDNFEIFDRRRTFLIEMPYKYYVKDLQAEINNDKTLFPSKKHLEKIKNDKEILQYIKILDNYIYFWASEDLTKFKLLTEDDIYILKSKEIKKSEKKIFSLLYLTCVSIEMTIENYTKFGMEDELNQKKIIYERLIDMYADNEQWIADYFFMKYINEMEFINTKEKPLRNIFTENEFLAIKYFVKNEKKIIVYGGNDLLFLIKITEKNEFEDIGYILVKDIDKKYLDKEIDAIILHNIIEKNGKLFKNTDFINTDEKYVAQFNM